MSESPSSKEQSTSAEAADSEWRDKTISGVAWSGGGQLLRQAFTLAVQVVLARLLTPDEFGLIAMVAVLVTFATLFGEFGIGAAVVQKQDITEEHLSTGFWLNFAAGIVLASLFVVAAPAISSFYEEPRLVPITIAMSSTFVANSLAVVQKSLLQRDLNFKAIALIDVAAFAVASAVAIFLAIRGAGVWALVAQAVLVPTISSGSLWAISIWRPTLSFSRKAASDLVGFGVSLLGTRLLNYGTRHLDDVLIGRYLGSVPLGLYNRAYAVMMLPLQNVSRVLSRVMFPSLARIQRDLDRVKRVFLQASRAVALVTFPSVVGLFIVADLLVPVVLGGQWLSIVPVLRILCVAALVQSISSLNGNLYLSQGRPGLQLKVGGVVRIVALAGIVIGLRWGITGVAASVAIVSVATAYPAFVFAGRLVKLSFKEHLANLIGPAGATLLMAVPVALMHHFLPSQVGMTTRLIVMVAVGIAVYWVTVSLFSVRAYTDLKTIVVAEIRARKADGC